MIKVRIYQKNCGDAMYYTFLPNQQVLVPVTNRAHRARTCIDEVEERHRQHLLHSGCGCNCAHKLELSPSCLAKSQSD